MHKRIGLVVVAVMLIGGLLPFLAGAEPTRTLSAEIVDVMLDGELGPDGEYASGTHEVSYLVNNTGTEYFTDLTTVYMKVFYPNDTLYMSMEEDSIIAVDNETSTMGEFVFGDIILPEGEFTIVINATLRGVNSSAEIDVTVADVVDLSIDSDFFEPEGTYPLSEEMMPSYSVEYNGNVMGWAGNVTVDLVITYVDSEPNQVSYDEEMEIMMYNSTPVDPGHEFSMMFGAGWTPAISGQYRAVFTVDATDIADDYYPENDTFTVFFFIEEAPSIEGWVKTSTGTPVSDVNVKAMIGSIDTNIMTDASGYYQFMDLAPGIYSLEFTKLWSTSELNSSVEVFDGQTTVVNATINKMAVGGLEGKVFLPDGVTPAVGAEVSINVPGEPLATEITNEDGNYSFTTVKAGQISVFASLEGYENDERPSFLIIEQIWNPLDLTLGEIQFTVDFSPPDGELSISISPTITLQFSRPINRSTVNESTIYMVDLTTSETLPVVFSFIDVENKVLVEPENLLEYNRDYRITVTDMVEDVNGNPFPDIRFASFTTEVQIVEVELQSFYPGDDQSEVPIDISITATFPEPMDGSTINTDTFQIFISGGGGSPIPGSVVYYSNNYTARFTPASNLQYNGRYSVSLNNLVEPLDPNHIFLGATWSFETMPLITTGTVMGYVLDDNGEPFLPTEVTINIQKGDQNPISLNVDQAGKFERAGLEAGLWTITIQVPDYKKHTDEFTIVAGEDTNLQDIELDEKEEDGGIMDNIGAIVLVILVIVIVLILLYVFLGRRERPVEAVEEPSRARGRPAAFGGARERESLREREPYYDEIAEGEFMCPVCGNVVGPEDPDCPSCGAEFEEDLFECPECGTLIPGDAMECPDCGAKFEEEEDEEGEEYEEEEEEPDITEDYEVDELDEEEIPFRERE